MFYSFALGFDIHFRVEVNYLFHFLSSLHIFNGIFLLFLGAAKNNLFLHDFSEVIVFWISVELDWAEVVEISSKNLILLRES